VIGGLPELIAFKSSCCDLGNCNCCNNAFAPLLNIKELVIVNIDDINIVAIIAATWLLFVISLFIY
jgi:hypothetical protein